VDRNRVEQAVRDLLRALGEDPEREGLAQTPRRVAQAYQELLCGYAMDPESILSVQFDADVRETDAQDVVLLRDIEFSSLCEHHLLPFFGRVHVAYVPGDSLRVVGISKLARLVECFSRRLQLQERLTRQIAGAVQRHLDARGVLVACEARHECMACRGVRQRHATMLSVSTTGCVSEDARLREALLRMAGVGGGA